jgi:hypothetical protein
MMKQFLSVSALVGSLLFPAPQIMAQEIVHALIGSVSSINTADKTITLFQDSGSRATFRVMPSSNTRIAFDKKIADEVTPATEFQKQGAYVILFYFGNEENRTAVALKNLGAGPFSATTGEVTEWNGHDRSLSVRDKDGAIHSFKIDAQTVAETGFGAVNGLKFGINKGEQVRLVSSLKDGTPAVLFLREN